MLLTQTTTPEDVKALDRAELPQLCDEIRHAILESSAAVGGHVAPNLGVVELTVALHRVFNSPIDKIVFDVSHQTYAHKALTGRAYTYIDPEAFWRGLWLCQSRRVRARPVRHGPYLHVGEPGLRPGARS